jgi:hypothetical protein
MRPSTTSVVTDRRRLGLLLLVEMVAAVVLLAHPFTTTHPADATPPAATHASLDVPTAPTDPLTLSDGRTVSLVAMGGAQTADLEARIWAELDGAADAVTSFWGDDWPRNVSVVLAGTDEEFHALAGTGGSDIAAATTARRIVFAPGASTMSDASLRIVLRHELFHYAARGRTAADAPRWLTEGVADYVGRPPTPMPTAQRAAQLGQLPTDADLDTPGPVRSLAYDRAWWFSRFVASRYGAQSLRALYLAACGARHPDQGTAIKGVLGSDTAAVTAAWRVWLRG